MAAGVLISIVILSIAVYLFTYFGGYAQGVEDEVRTNQIAQFNDQFLSYQVKSLTIYDVITLANLAKDYNLENEYTDINMLGFIDFKFTNAPDLTNIIGSKNGNSNDIYQISEQYIGKLEDNKYRLIQYNCTVQVNSITERVSAIEITKK